MAERTNRLRGVEVYKLWWCWSCVNVSCANSVCNLHQFNFTLSLWAKRDFRELTMCVSLFIHCCLRCFFMFIWWFPIPSFRMYLWALHCSKQVPQMLILAKLLLCPSKLMKYVPFHGINCIFTLTSYFSCIHNTVCLS